MPSGPSHGPEHGGSSDRGSGKAGDGEQRKSGPRSHSFAKTEGAQFFGLLAREVPGVPGFASASGQRDADPARQVPNLVRRCPQAQESRGVCVWPCITASLHPTCNSAALTSKPANQLTINTFCFILFYSTQLTFTYLVCECIDLWSPSSLCCIILISAKLCTPHNTQTLTLTLLWCLSTQSGLCLWRLSSISGLVSILYLCLCVSHCCDLYLYLCNHVLQSTLTT